MSMLTAVWIWVSQQKDINISSAYLKLIGNFVFVFLLRTKAEAKEWLAVWIARAELQQYPHKVRHLHIDGGELKTTDLKDWANRGGGVVHVATPADHEAQARVERPIRTVTEGSRTIVAHGNGDDRPLMDPGMPALYLCPAYDNDMALMSG